MTLKEAIQSRHAVRRYLPKAIAPEAVESLRALIDELNSKGGVHMQLVVDEPNAFGKSMLSYGLFKGVRNYVAMVCRQGEDTAVGYYGEQVVLAAQTMGLNTCWVGLTYKNQPDAYEVLPGETLIGLVALGYGETQGRPHPQRKGIEYFCRMDGKMPEWFREGMEAALLAPTSLNMQKFEFQLLANDCVKASTRSALINSYTQTDLGIVMCHFEIGAGSEHFCWDPMSASLINK